MIACFQILKPNSLENSSFLMNPNTLSYSIHFMEEFIEHPIIHPFLKGMLEKSPQREKIFSKDSNFLFFEDILQKLKENKYRNVSEWFRDVHLFWDNIIQVFGETSLEARVVYAAEKQFNRCNSNLETWSNQVYSLRTKLTQLANSVPDTIKQTVPRIGSARALKLNDKEISEQQYISFINATKLLKQNDTTDLLKIMKDLQPELDTTNQIIDVAQLSLSTFHALQKCVDNKLQERRNSTL